MDAAAMDSQLKDMMVDLLFLDLTPDEIETETPLSEYGIDSFLMLELIVGIEETFDVRFPQGEIKPEMLRTVASLRTAIQAKLAES